MSEETAIGKAMRAYLHDLGWETRAEVQMEMYGRVADIVAWRDSLVMVVECKRTLGLAVLEQVEGWRGLAHYRAIAIAAPHRRAYRAASWGGRFAARLLYDYGMGLYVVHLDERSRNVHEAFRPQLERTAQSRYIVAAARAIPDDWQAEAGDAGSTHYTPFRETCRILAQFVAEHPGCAMKEAVDGIAHHYATPGTACNALAKWIRLGKVPGVEMQREGRRIMLWPGVNE